MQQISMLDQEFDACNEVYAQGTSDRYGVELLVIFAVQLPIIKLCRPFGYLGFGRKVNRLSNQQP